MNRRRVQLVEAGLICLGGLWLLIEISSAVRFNMWWIDRSILDEPRFALYLWAGVAVAVLLIVQAVVAVRARILSSGFVYLQAPLAIILAGLLVQIAHGWRIRTDVGPADGVKSFSQLPVAVRVLADPWLAGFMIMAVIGCIVWSLTSGARD